MKNSVIQMLLITTNPKIEKMAKGFCESQHYCEIELTISHQVTQFAAFDIILMTHDIIQLDAAIFDKIYDDNNYPAIILLHESHSDYTPHQYEKYINEELNVVGITRTLFFQTIITTYKKQQVLYKLLEQRSILNDLIGSLQHESKHPDLLSTEQVKTTLLKLVDENNELIKQTASQCHHLKKLSRIDPLTGVGNRNYFNETLAQLISYAERENKMLALLLIDLNKFKQVNKANGYAVGDTLLTSVVRRIKKILRKGDFVARIGGDEFTVILTNLKSIESASIVAKKIIQELEKPYDIFDKSITISANIGIACYPLVSTKGSDLITYADQAMYQAKNDVNSQFAYATIQFHNECLNELHIEDELRKAIDNNELKVVYQPIYHLPTMELIGFEALIRWNNATLGEVEPDKFITVAEKCGLIRRIGIWTLHEICRQIASWLSFSNHPFKIFINLSPVQFIDRELLSTIYNQIRYFKLPFSMFEFEMTEISVTHQIDLIKPIMHEMKKFGMSIALDDFGTGYSSITHLKYLPINTLKIDKTFIDGINKNKTDNDIICAILALASKLNLIVIAEGVETETQLQYLIKQNCKFAQGFHLSTPLDAELVSKLLLTPVQRKMRA